MLLDNPGIGNKKIRVSVTKGIEYYMDYLEHFLLPASDPVSRGADLEWSEEESLMTLSLASDNEAGYRPPIWPLQEALL